MTSLYFDSRTQFQIEYGGFILGKMAFLPFPLSHRRFMEYIHSNDNAALENIIQL